MELIVQIIHVLAALALIGLILIQHGKGADAGAAFGSGSSQTVFGGSGSGNFLTRSTAILATVFFLTSLGLAIFAKRNAGLSEELIPAPEVITIDAEALDSDVPVIDAPVDGDVPVIDSEAVDVDVPVINEEAVEPAQ